MIQQDGNDSYIWNKENSFMSFGTNAQERMRIDSSGNVGIGTTDPDMLLHVQSNSTFAYVAIEGDSTFDSGINLKRNGSNQWFIFNDASNNDALQIEGGGGSVDQFVTVAQTGNVGIGTTSPDALLDVENSSGAAEIQIKSLNSSDCTLAFGDSADTDVGRIRYAHSADAMLFFTAANERLRIDNAGNLLIKTGEIDLQGGNKTIKTSAGFLQVGTSGSHHTAFIIGGTERMRIDDSGRLLINNTTNASTFPLQVTAHTDANAIGIIGRPSDDIGELKWLENDRTTILGEIQYRQDHVNFRHRQGDIRFATGGLTERMRIDSSGNVGIGTTSAIATLDVVGSTLPNYYLSTSKTDSTSKYSLIANQQYHSSAEPEGAAVIGSEFTAADNNIHIGGYFGEANAATTIRFHTANALNTRSGTERMRIDSSGSVGIGNSNPSHRLSIAGTANNVNSEITITATSVASAYIGANANGLNLGTDTAGIVFKTGVTGGGSVGSTGTERMRIDSSGRVGVGTSSPVGRLTVIGSAGSGDDGIQITSGSTTTGSKAALFFVPSTTASVTTGSAIKSERLSPDGSDLQFYTVSALGNTPVRAMTIDKSQRVGIGTTSPGSIFQVKVAADKNIGFDTSDGEARISSYNDAVTSAGPLHLNGSYVRFEIASNEKARIDSSGRLLIGGTSTADNDHANINANGTLTIRRASSGDDCIVIKEGSTNSLLIEASGNVFNYNVGSFAYTSYDNEAGVAGPYAALGSFSGEARISAGSTGSDDVPLVFRTSDGGTLAEKMKLTHDGLLIINNLYNTTSSGAANVFVGSNSQLFRSTSSIKYKENVQDATHGLAKLLELRPVTYTSKQPDNDSTVYGGLIAEEVHEAGLSEFVQYATDGSPDALAYGNMVSLCVKAIQEQQSIIKSLETRIAALES
jgi:hypothetical protein